MKLFVSSQIGHHRVTVRKDGDVIFDGLYFGLTFAADEWDEIVEWVADVRPKLKQLEAK